MTIEYHFGSITATYDKHLKIVGQNENNIEKKLDNLMATSLDPRNMIPPMNPEDNNILLKLKNSLDNWIQVSLCMRKIKELMKNSDNLLNICKKMSGIYFRGINQDLQTQGSYYNLLFNQIHAFNVLLNMAHFQHYDPSLFIAVKAYDKLMKLCLNQDLSLFQFTQVIEELQKMGKISDAKKFIKIAISKHMNASENSNLNDTDIERFLLAAYPVDPRRVIECLENRAIKQYNDPLFLLKLAYL